MSRFIVTGGSNFTPYSYEELIKPVQSSAEAHAAAEDAYGQLSLETEALRQYISDNPEDRRAKQMYDNYLTKLNTFQNNLYNYGFTSGTRRDLTAARNAYSSDIVRLQKAVQDRQARSQEYWDMKHKNPDMIMGTDPGISGLDNYLSDDNYGRNWYQYSGNQFASEVASEAKARANEMIDLAIKKNPRAAGYLQTIKQEGWTNDQVNRGINLAKEVLSGNRTISESTPMDEAIVASVLLSQLQRSGAANNVTPDEFARLFQYGAMGLAKGIGKREVNLIADRSGVNTSGGSKNPTTTTTVPAGRRQYSLNQIQQQISAQNADKFREQAQKLNPIQEPVVVTVNGNAKTISNSYDAQTLLNSLGREDITNTYGFDPEAIIPPRVLGPFQKAKPIEIDAMLDGENKHMRFVQMNNSEKEKYGIDKKQKGVLIQEYRGGKWVPADTELIKNLNSDYGKYNQAKAQLSKDNPNFKLYSVTASPKSVRDAREALDAPSDYPEELLHAALLTKSRQAEVTPATIAGTGEDTKTYRENLANNLKLSGSYTPGKSSTSTYNYYPLAPGGLSFAKEGTSDPEKVFGRTGVSDKSEINYNISAVQALPEDIYNENKVRVTTNQGTFGVTPSRLSNDIAAEVDKMRMPMKDPNNTDRTIDEKGYIHFLMMPIEDPVGCYYLSPHDEAVWIAAVNHYLGDYFAPVWGDGSFIRPMDIVADIDSPVSQDLQGLLYNAIVNHMDDLFQDPRDYNQLYPQPHASGTVSKKELE